MLNTFSYTFGHFYILFGELYVQILCLLSNEIVFLQLLEKSSLYMLDSNPLSGMWFTNIFRFPYVLFHFILLFNLLCRHLKIIYINIFFAYVALALGAIWKNHCQDFLFCTFLGFLWFQILIHFELIFVYDERRILMPFFCMWTSISSKTFIE